MLYSHYYWVLTIFESNFFFCSWAEPSDHRKTETFMCETFWIDVIPFNYFCCCFPCLRRYIQKLFPKTVPKNFSLRTQKLHQWKLQNMSLSHAPFISLRWLHVYYIRIWNLQYIYALSLSRNLTLVKWFNLFWASFSLFVQWMFVQKNMSWRLPHSGAFSRAERWEGTKEGGRKGRE